ncbi:MAG TPA: M15 family metallopeptidase [Bacillales bacterium]|nr:M15 family metallopeptidase [Bacillales bacterium]
MAQLNRWKMTFLLSGALSLTLSGCSYIQQYMPSDRHESSDQSDQSGAGSQQQAEKNDQSKTKTNSKPTQQQKWDVPDRFLLKNTIKTTPEGKRVVTNPASLLVCADKKRNLPADYEPKNLVIPDVYFPYGKNAKREKMHMRKVAAEALEQLFAAAKQDGIRLMAISGYRSYERQVSVFNWHVSQKGSVEKANRVSARPGQSEHQTGLSMDISSEQIGPDLTQKFGDTKAGKWVAAHAAEYGFILRYPPGKEAITGYEYEPWHLRYVGKQPAETIANHHLTLEEYLSE